jgi:hypothetical protein
MVLDVLKLFYSAVIVCNHSSLVNNDFFDKSLGSLFNLLYSVPRSKLFKVFSKEIRLQSQLYKSVENTYYFRLNSSYSFSYRYRSGRGVEFWNTIQKPSVAAPDPDPYRTKMSRIRNTAETGSDPSKMFRMRPDPHHCQSCSAYTHTYTCTVQKIQILLIHLCRYRVRVGFASRYRC